MSHEKLISKEQTVSQKIRQELFKEMSDMIKLNFDRAHTASNYAFHKMGIYYANNILKKHKENTVSILWLLVWF